ncbi:peptidylprolyl isomerase [Novosphingobium sp. KCTC 2891]|uniref:peptidylprolyl isomerase n=1 Tax=Novosphingobium sp. KCTC 2891 TaxID=2989730 RepID=UPI00222136ED|nr:peptidylprolyl isomerase [Novosphingobium sp. KCTC 2891]MCW1381517.1 peptidylprolyl isomerase [Novosphingobium sp. KCTC 2891]
MFRTSTLACLLAASAAFAGPASAAPAPAEIVAAAPATDWAAIDLADLLVMDLASGPADREVGASPRRIVIQLMPPPFSQGWIGNIRKLAAAHWWDGTSVNRVQDNYVVQWGDAEADDKAKAKPLPPGLRDLTRVPYQAPAVGTAWINPSRDAYAARTGIVQGWPVSFAKDGAAPVHCYGMVGAGRAMPPDTGSGAELYAVIGTPPRHLDRNIALVGRVIEGIEHLSSLPRGTGPLGFYEKAGQRVPISSIRLGTEMPGLPRYEYLSTDSTSFARYADARANRQDAFFVKPAGGADICNVPVPVRRVP